MLFSIVMSTTIYNCHYVETTEECVLACVHHKYRYGGNIIICMEYNFVCDFITEITIIQYSAWHHERCMKNDASCLDLVAIMDQLVIN